MKPFRAMSRGYYSVSDDGGLVTGCVWPVEGADRSHLAIVCGDTVVRLIEASVEVGDGELPRARSFSWDVPDLLQWRSAPFKIVDLVTGDELQGTSELPRTKPAPGLVGPWGREPAWWRGVSASLTRWLNVVAEGLWVDVDPAAVGARFARSEGPPLAPDLTWGVRLTAENEVGWAAHHALAPSLAQADEKQALRIWLKLAQAPTAFSQRHCEIFLSCWNGQRFHRLRRLRRSRVLRSFSFLDVVLALEPDERELAAAGELAITVAAQPCSGLVVCPPLLTPAPGIGARFEDGRLEGAFDDAERLTQLYDEERGRALLLKPPPPRKPLHAGEAPFTEIIVPVYNGHDVVARCLRALQDNTDTPFAVLVVDDGSREYTTRLLDAIVEGDDRFRIHRRAINRGYTKSINEAVKLTSADWVVILNSDTVVSKGWLGKLHQAAALNPQAGMVGPLSNAATWQSVPQVKNADNTWSQNDFISPEIIEQVQQKVAAASECAYPEAPLLNGFCTLIARAVFETAGLFDEEAFPQGYGEEVDMCLRATLAGFKLIIADNCFVYHEKSVSFGSANRSRLTRAGGLELRNKHLGLNIPALERMMQNQPAMLRLRSALNNLEAELRT